MAAVAQRLGVAPATLRTWDRRYGLGPSEHSAGAHRRYTPADVSRLGTMRRLTLSGVSPVEAARVSLGQPLFEAPADVPAGEFDEDALSLTQQAPPDAAQPGEPALPLPDRSGRLALVRGSGGRVLALPGADAAVRGLGRAAMALDARTVTALIREQVEQHGVLHTWDHVLRPVLVAVGARWAATGDGVEVEHLLSDCTAVVLRDVAASPEAPASPERRPVILACAPGEWHALPLHALSAALAERGVDSRTLGPATPGSALAAAVRRTGPAALFVWSQLPASADPATLEAIPIRRPPTSVIVGGPGWAPDRLPERVNVAVDLPHAVELVDRALGA